MAYIENRLLVHQTEALRTYDFKKDWFVICLQGSQNYKIADSDSDIDSKLLILPEWEDLVFNCRPISNTHVMSDSEEHVDIKDVREYFKLFRKSNINFTEILFTDYWLTNPLYTDLWLELRLHREEITRINPYAAIHYMYGMMQQKYKALDHPYPSRLKGIQEHGYDFKELSHIVRVGRFLRNYVNKMPYEECLTNEKDIGFRKYLLELKRHGGGLTKEEAFSLAEEELEIASDTMAKYKNIYTNELDKKADKILDDVLRELMRRSIKKDMEG